MAVISQIKGANSIAYPMWQWLVGQLHLKPIGMLQFCCKASSRLIEVQCTRYNTNLYKLSTPGSNQRGQQAQKHPTSALKRIENLEIHKNPKFIHFQIGLNRKSSLIPPNPQIKVLNLCNSMLSMSMATEGLDLYVESMRC